MYSVIIVEDEIIVSAGLQNMIHWSDMNMVVTGTARNGREGLELYHQMQPDIILTDIKMPVMDGLELISQIRQEDTATKIIVMSGYDDFDLVRKAFKMGISDYILKLQMMPEEMETVIRSVQKQLQEDSSLGERKSKAAEQEELRQRAREKALDAIVRPNQRDKEFSIFAETAGILQDSLGVIIMEMYPVALEVYPHNPELLGAVHSLIQNVLQENMAGAVWMEQGNRYVAVVNTQEMDCLQKTLVRIQEAVRSGMNLETVFGISKLQNGFENLHRMYRQAVKALEIAALLEETMVYFENPDYDRKFRKMLADAQQQLADLDGWKDGCRGRILEEMGSLMDGRVLDSLDMKKTVARWIHWSAGKDGSHQKRIAQLERQTEEQVRAAKSLKVMLALFEDYLEQKTSFAAGGKTLNRELSQAIAYIKKHYCEASLSLSETAQVVSLNKDYLSKLFKKELGIGFSDYVNMQRIKKAQELLVTTHMKSYEISILVGFKDESYFSRVFKKIVGMRPNEYKRSNVPEGE